MVQGMPAILSFSSLPAWDILRADYTPPFSVRTGDTMIKETMSDQSASLNWIPLDRYPSRTSDIDLAEQWHCQEVLFKCGPNELGWSWYNICTYGAGMDSCTRWLWGDHKPRKVKRSQLSLGVERIRSSYFLDFWRKCLGHTVLHREKNMVTIFLSYQAWWRGMVSPVSRWYSRPWSFWFHLPFNTVFLWLSSSPNPSQARCDGRLARTGLLSRWASHQQSKVLGLWLRRAESTHDWGHTRGGMFFEKFLAVRDLKQYWESQDW